MQKESCHNAATGHQSCWHAPGQPNGKCFILAKGCCKPMPDAKQFHAAGQWSLTDTLLQLPVTSRAPHYLLQA